MNLNKKYKEIPLFIILISTILIGGAIAQSVNWLLTTDFTFDPTPPSEGTYSATFTVNEDTPYINAEANLTGLGIIGEPIYYTATVYNIHPTLNLDSGWTITITLINGGEMHTDTATCGVTMLALIGNYPGILDGTYTPNSSGMWTISLALDNLNWVS